MSKIFIFGGKAQVGKDTTSTYLRNYAKEKGLRAINLQYSSYIKMYAKNISDWDGSEETKPRVLLQELGQTIRTEFDKRFFINRIIDDIKVYQSYFDIITISDARLPLELDAVKEEFKDAVKVHIIRPNFNPYKSLKEKNHPTELALDDYKNFDYEIINNGSLDDLKIKANNLFDSY